MRTGTWWAMAVLMALAAGAEGCRGPSAHVAEGALCGTRNSRGHSVFLGIPYAKPPVGDLRWKPPVPVEPWEGPRACSTECSECLQAVLTTALAKGSEDCLCLNVYAPAVSNDTLLPVMVWIHGGAFISGSGNAFMYNPVDMVSKGVVVVTMNYRLGVLGFLNVGAPGAAGNQGLLDQREALRWVRRNAAAFGGDARRVTLFGESAGAVSAHLHALAPASRGLFARVIAQSGSALNAWGFNRSAECATARLLAATGCPAPRAADANAALACLRAKDARSLQVPSNKFKCTEGLDDSGGLIPFPPTLDGTFLQDEPIALAEQCHPVSMMVGLNSGEGMISLPSLRARGGYAEWAGRIARGEGLLQPGANCTPSAARREAWGRAAQRHFLRGRPLSASNADGFVNFSTFFSFVWGVTLALERRVACPGAPPQFLYLFDADTLLNHAKLAFGAARFKGAAHADELCYLFRCKVDDLLPMLPASAKVTRERLVRMWTDFAKHGNPTPKIDKTIPVAFKQYTKEDKNYMYIGNAAMEVRKNAFEKDLQFYSSLIGDCS